MRGREREEVCHFVSSVVSDIVLLTCLSCYPDSSLLDFAVIVVYYFAN